MHELIREKLNELQNEKGIRMLYACESGSRAWGFPSPDSDYDVRFIYSRKSDWYLSLKERPDTIEVPVNDVLDIGGWDIKKSLALLWKSNAPLMEWIQSPIVYSADEKFLADMRNAAEQCFSPIATMYHYLSMSKKYIDTCFQADDVKLKHYFYALRATTACVWIREKGTMAPIELPRMLNELKLSINDQVFEMIRLKAEREESYRHPRSGSIDAFLKAATLQNEKAAGTLDTGKGHLDTLDAVFRKFLA